MIINHVKNLILEAKEYEDNEDYKNSKKIGGRIGAGLGIMAGGLGMSVRKAIEAKSADYDDHDQKVSEHYKKQNDWQSALNSKADKQYPKQIHNADFYDNHVSPDMKKWSDDNPYPQAGNDHMHSMLHDPHTYAAIAGGAALGGVANYLVGKYHGHKMGKEMAENPTKGHYRNNIVGDMKANLKVDTPIKSLHTAIVGGMAGAAMNHDNPFQGAIVGGLAGAAAGGLHQAIGGSILAVPKGLIHGKLVKMMRKKKDNDDN